MRIRSLLLAGIFCLPVLLEAATVATPVITPRGDTYFDSVQVSLYDGTAGATIYYTTDGMDPTVTSTPFTFPFLLADSATVKAIAVKAGSTDSAIAAADFEIVPTPEVVAPTVSVTGKKSIKTKKTKVTISGTSTNATSIEYQIGDEDFRVASGTTTWSFKAKLKPGKNVIYVYAIGEEEDSDPAKITVTVKKK